jgi:hypothetical protein
LEWYLAVGAAQGRANSRQVGCSARSGFDGDVGGDSEEHEGVDACHAENGVEYRAIETVGRLSSDDWFIGPGGDVERVLAGLIGQKAKDDDPTHH